VLLLLRGDDRVAALLQCLWGHLSANEALQWEEEILRLSAYNE